MGPAVPARGGLQFQELAGAPGLRRTHPFGYMLGVGRPWFVLGCKRPKFIQHRLQWPQAAPPYLSPPPNVSSGGPAELASGGLAGRVCGPSNALQFDGLVARGPLHPCSPTPSAPLPRLWPCHRACPR
jgi:hypothetical protein